MKVLIAEDNAALATVLQFNLGQAGAEVTWASDGLSAIEHLNRTAFDLLITDYQMPGASGEEVLEAARKSPMNADIPVILLTARELELDVERLKARYRLAATLPKPFSPREIVELSRWLVRQETTRPRA